jgi:elongator complex protein 2
VNVVKFYTPPSATLPLLLTGSVDRTIRIWRPVDATTPLRFTQAATLEGHAGSVNCIAVTQGLDIIASGAADGSVKLWRVTQTGDEVQAVVIEAICLNPRYFPLAMALGSFEHDNKRDIVLAVGGTRTAVQIYAASEDSRFELKTTLTGHEGWIRSLAFTAVNPSEPARGLLLASASQDKYIRLWRLQANGGDVQPVRPNEDQSLLGSIEPTLSNKAHVFEINRSKYSVTFEALLLGHEDWVYTVAWNRDPHKPQLLSASADNSLVIWESDPVSGVWFPAERMGEISTQKGSTTATGSAGGFWIGLWSPDGRKVTCLGRTGSWRVWTHDEDLGAWSQTIGVGGHVRSAADIAWEPSGGYLLSTSGDQTTRLHAKWDVEGRRNWHEFARPQIHGYDLNCVASLGPSRCVSGADEKLLRVFNGTKAMSQLLEKLSGLELDSSADLAEAANIPVLGLSNKAIGEAMVDEDALNGAGEPDEQQQPSQVVSLDSDHPPLEDHLSRHTLWPEHEKLYGHGYEISAVAASYDHSVIATACKASSLDYAVIRLYDTTTWNEIRPPLAAHTLTITALRFSRDDKYLLSVGRDRQWALFGRDDADKTVFRLVTSNPKGHSRMILSASWAPISETSQFPRVFATAGRDRSVKLWVLEDGDCVCRATIAKSIPVTAVDFLPQVVDGELYLAVGEDSGLISLHALDLQTLSETKENYSLPKRDCPSKAITQLSWRPTERLRQRDTGEEEVDPKPTFELAVASEDSSVRIYSIADLNQPWS